MLLTPKDEKEDNDFFESDEEIPEVRVKRPKKPSYRPDDPNYWDQEESEWEHLKPRPRLAMWLWIGGVVVLIALIIGCWFRYFSPYVMMPFNSDTWRI